jgi:GT2 family glycosyltransferase
VAVDDGSPMDTSFLDDLADKTIHLEKNVGFAKAVNTGLRWALKQDTEYIGCANDDIEVREDWLEALKEPFSKWDNVGVTGIVETMDREEFKNEKGRKITEGGLIGDKMQCGALWLMKKKVLKEVGIYDEQFLIGGEEDVDLFLRIRDKHHKHIIMSDKSVFWHKQGATRWNDEIEDGFKAKNKAIEQENYDKFAKKWGFDIRTHGLNFYEYVLED